MNAKTSAVLSAAGWDLYNCVVARADDVELQLKLVQPLARSVRASTKDIDDVRAFLTRGRSPKG